MPRSTARPDVKAAALADLLAGEQPAVVAERYRLKPSTVRSWKLRLEADATPAATPHATTVATSQPLQRPTAEAQQRQIGALILDLLVAKLEASAALARAVSNPEWLKTQSASELAVLGQYLDGTAFAIGDRLAGGRSAAPDAAGDESTEPAD